MALEIEFTSGIFIRLLFTSESRVKRSASIMYHSDSIFLSFHTVLGAFTSGRTYIQVYFHPMGYSEEEEFTSGGNYTFFPLSIKG